MIKTVIFDMDGVIVDTEPVHYFAYRQHFNHLNIDVTDEVYASFTGFSTKNTYQRLKEMFNILDDVDGLVDYKRELFNNAFDDKEDLDLIPGVRKLIEDLHSNGMQLIVASSASNVTIGRVFRRFGLHKYFSHIVSGEDFPKSKPHPAIFLKAAELSGHSLDECIVIEDSTNGIKAAKAAGIYCVGYVSEHSMGQDTSLADMVIADFAELDFEKIKKLK